MESKIEIISNTIKLGIFDNNTISKLVNLPLEEIIRIRKELKLERKYTVAYKKISEEDKRDGNTASMKKDNYKNESIYDRALGNMTAEDYKMIEELFNN